MWSPPAWIVDLWSHAVEAKFWPYHLHIAAEIKTDHTNWRFSNLSMSMLMFRWGYAHSDFGSWLTGSGTWCALLLHILRWLSAHHDSPVWPVSSDLSHPYNCTYRMFFVFPTILCTLKWLLCMKILCYLYKADLQTCVCINSNITL